MTGGDARKPTPANRASPAPRPDDPGAKDLFGPRYMTLFIAVMTSRTLQEAAERLAVTQPAVTKAIRQLERDTGLSLFERGHAKLTPTPAAQQLVPHVQAALDQVRAVQRMALRMRPDRADHISVAATDVAVGALVPGAIKRFAQQRPAVRVEVISHATPSTVIEMVRSGDVDLGVSQRFNRPLGPHSPVRPVVLMEDELSVVLPAGHELERKSIIRAVDLAGIPIARLRSNSHAHDLTDAAFRSQGVVPEVCAEASTSYAVCAIVATGRCVGLINPLQLAAGAFPGVVARPFRPRIPITTCAYVLASPAAPSESIAMFMEFLLESGRELSA